MKMWIVISALIVLLSANTANALPKGGQSLVRSMKAYHDPNGTLNYTAGNFVGYVRGVVDTTLGTHYCSPDDVPFETLLEAVSNYINKHSELWDVSANVLVEKALNEAFPCKP